MPDCCAAVRCSNYRNKCPNLSFFRFPKDEERCKIWTHFAGRELQDTVYMNANFRLCSAHFSMDQFSNPELNRLKTTAVPNLESSCESPSPSFEFMLNDINHHVAGTCSNVPIFPGVQQETEVPLPPKIARKENRVPLKQGTVVSTMVQTDPVWANLTGIMALESRVGKLEVKVKTLETSMIEVEAQNYELRCQLSEQQTNSETQSQIFGVEYLHSTADDNMFRYHTGFTFDGFNKIFNLMMSMMSSISYTDTIPSIHLGLKDQLLLTLMRVHNKDTLEDLSLRFNVTSHTVGIIIDSWVNHMYIQFHNLSTWPHRDTIIQNLPSDFAQDFPLTLAIVDCTEILVEETSLQNHFDTYSALKGLIATDPKGSIIFVSRLCSKAFSPSQLFHDSGIGDHLQKLKHSGKIQQGDSLMVQDDFSAHAEFAGIGLQLLNAPTVKAQGHLSPLNLSLLEKMASHRILVKQALARIKSFQILCGMVPHELQDSVNKLWFVCAHLTNFNGAQ